MSDFDRGYQQAQKDAEFVCGMMARSWRERAATSDPGRAKVAVLVAEMLELTSQSIGAMEPGFVAPAD
ncbi:hypothetical protein [Methylobacterium mesophilicum]